MAKIFLDANYFIDFAEKRKKEFLSKLVDKKIYISILSIHILAYISKYEIPNEKLTFIAKKIALVPLTQSLLELALCGPTKDLEDNIQLISAVNCNCDLFLTRDKNILKMKLFGKTKIASEI